MNGLFTDEERTQRYITSLEEENKRLRGDIVSRAERVFNGFGAAGMAAELKNASDTIVEQHNELVQLRVTVEQFQQSVEGVVFGGVVSTKPLSEQHVKWLQAFAQRLMKKVENHVETSTLARAAKPIADYYVKRAAWDGGCALPPEPTDGQKLDFVNAVKGAR